MKEPKVNEVLLKIKYIYIYISHIKKWVHKIKTYWYNVLIGKLLLMKITN